jgi:hypothetical protein
MPKTEAFAETFATLRGILEPYAGKMVVTEKPGAYQLSSATMKDRTGRPLFVAAVQIMKNYVSFHLIPVYTSPKLLEGMSPALRKRMQGKACFNFTAIEPAQVDELAALTRKGLESFKNIKLPWANR